MESFPLMFRHGSLQKSLAEFVAGASTKLKRIDFDDIELLRSLQHLLSLGRRLDFFAVLPLGDRLLDGKGARPTDDDLSGRHLNRWRSAASTTLFAEGRRGRISTSRASTSGSATASAHRSSARAGCRRTFQGKHGSPLGPGRIGQDFLQILVAPFGVGLGIPDVRSRQKESARGKKSENVFHNISPVYQCVRGLGSRLCNTDFEDPEDFL